MGGATKNVLAIGAGISDGLGFGANTRIALVTRGLMEITQLGLALGAEKDTFMGLSGMGDLVLTCTDNQSRNRRFGLELAKGANVDEVKKQMQDRGLASEDWGGETLAVQISALNGDKIEDLLDSILLQAEVMELKANPVAEPQGQHAVRGTYDAYHRMVRRTERHLRRDRHQSDR